MTFFTMWTWNADKPVFAFPTRHLLSVWCTAVASHDSFPLWQHLEGECFGGTVYMPLGSNSVSAYSISCMLCQNCSRGLGGQFSIVCIQSMIIIISLLLSSDHTVQCNPVESACTTMTSDPSPRVPHFERLHPSSMHTPDERKASSFVFLFLLLFQKKLVNSVPCSLFFSAKDFFLKEKSLTVVIWLHFFSELILSRVEKQRSVTLLREVTEW